MPYLILQTFCLPPTPISSSVQFSCSVVSNSVTPWTAARQASLSITNSQSLLKLMSITSVMPSNHLILCHPLLLPPLIFPSIRVFSNKSALHIRWPKDWSFSFSISPSNEYSGLISFRMDIINEHNQSDFCFDHLVMSMGSIVSSAVGNGCLLWPACSLDKIVICCPVSFCIPGPNLPVILYICWLPNCAYQSPIMKRTFFFLMF